MSIVRKNDFEDFDEDGWTWTQEYNFDSVCLMCGEKLTVPFVFWGGVGKELSLHPNCAAFLGGALMRDYFETVKGREAANAWWRPLKATIEDGQDSPQP